MYARARNMATSRIRNVRKKLFIQINDVKHVKFNLRLKKKNKNVYQQTIDIYIETRSA